MDLIEYIGSLPPVKITRLYDSHFTCLAILRSLSPIAKQYIYRLIFLDDYVPQALLSSWALFSASQKHETTLQILLRLQIFTIPSNLTEPSYSLHKAFRSHIRSILCSGIEKQLQDVPQHVIDASPTKEEVDMYAAQQWETLLLFTVGGPQRPDSPLDLPGTTPLDIGDLLLSARVISLTTGSSQQQQSHSVTQHGFQFLLSDTYTQLWILLQQYINQAEQQTGNELSSALGFLMQFGFQGTKPMHFGAFTDDQKNIAAHMCQLGVLLPFQLRHHNNEIWLQPTRLAVLLASGSRNNSIGGGGGGGGRGGRIADKKSLGGTTPHASDISDGFIITETNFRIYAYTSSAVRQSILRLFIRCDALLPNLFVGTLDRDSIVNSLENGMTAEQIISYLRQHAHPRVASRVPIVPGVVADQIRLWYRELHRLKAETAVVYKNFESGQLYLKVVSFSEKIGALLVRDDAKKEFVGTAARHDDVKMHIKTMKKELGFS